MKYWISVFLIIASKCAMAQNISMEFPAFAGKTYYFIIFQGSKQETVQQDTIPANGKFTLQIPKQYAPYTGMCRWLITGTAEGGGLDMAIPGYDFAVNCLSDKPDNYNITYNGFDAVNELNRLHASQQTIVDKFETMSRATQVYDKQHKLYKKFAQEKELQEKAYDAFQQDLTQNPNFNARFLPIVNLTQGIPHRLTDDYDQKALLVNEFITQKMSFEDLYVSGHWQAIIQSWVVLQINVVNDREKFAQDFKLISDRIKNPVHYTDFVGKLTYQLTQYGKDDYIDAIAKIVSGSGKVSEYLGVMTEYLKFIVGMKAPDIVFEGDVFQNGKAITTPARLSEVKAKYKLLIFGANWCPSCVEELKQLISLYEKWKLQGVEVVFISLDTDQKAFRDFAIQMPFISNCDYKKWDTPAAKAYFVSSSPTMYLLDEHQKIILRPVSMQQLDAYLQSCK